MHKSKNKLGTFRGQVNWFWWIFNVSHIDHTKFLVPKQKQKLDTFWTISTAKFPHKRRSTKLWKWSLALGIKMHIHYSLSVHFSTNIIWFKYIFFLFKILNGIFLYEELLSRRTGCLFLKCIPLAIWARYMGKKNDRRVLSLYKIIVTWL